MLEQALFLEPQDISRLEVESLLRAPEPEVVPLFPPIHLDVF